MAACHVPNLTKEEVAKGHASANLNQTGCDALLRRNGFAIVARPKRGPAVWRLGDADYMEEKALALCKDEKIEK